MKNLSIVIAFLVFGMSTKAQNEIDTIHKNEFAFNILPYITVLGGGSTGSSSNFNLSYKRYLKKNYVLRSAFVFYPSTSEYRNDGVTQFERRIDTMNVFHSYISGGSRLQVNVGFEKLFKIKRMTHGLGIDLFYTQGSSYFSNVAWWEPNTSQSAANFYAPSNPNYGNNKVDSLSYSVKEKKNGVGAQFFYSARFRMTKRLYLSTTFGPSFTVNSSRVNNSNPQNLPYNNRKFTTMDFNLLLSDVSIAFRF